MALTGVAVAAAAVAVWRMAERRVRLLASVVLAASKTTIGNNHHNIVKVSWNLRPMLHMLVCAPCETAEEMWPDHNRLKS